MRLLILLLAAVCLPAQESPRAPAINAFGVRNAASFDFTAGLPGRGPAPGSMIVIQGAWLGPDEIVLATAPYPASLGDAQLELRTTATGEMFLIPLIHVWEFQLAGVVPLEIPLGPATITAVYRGRRSQPVEVEVQGTWPALFSVGQTGGGRRWRRIGSRLNRRRSIASRIRRGPVKR